MEGAQRSRQFFETRFGQNTMQRQYRARRQCNYHTTFTAGTIAGRAANTIGAVELYCLLMRTGMAWVIFKGESGVVCCKCVCPGSPRKPAFHWSSRAVRSEISGLSDKEATWKRPVAAVFCKDCFFCEGCLH